jgi:hypothetical protein
MAQLSRPYQIGLATILVLAAVWVVLLQGHSPSSSSTQEPAPVASTPAPAPAKAAPSSATTKHSGSTSGPSAPGVAGLTRAIDKARGAVSISEKNAKQLQEKSAQASSPTTTSQAPAAAAPAKTVAPTKTAPTATPTAPKTPAAPTVASRVNSPSRERAVEAQLAKGKIALILFWNPKGADDVVVHRAIHQLNAGSLHIALNEAPSSDIAAFGTITRGIQVYGTPTLLIVNKKGQTITLTGSEDSFAITQAISEARHS